MGVFQKLNLISFPQILYGLEEDKTHVQLSTFQSTPNMVGKKKLENYMLYLGYLSQEVIASSLAGEGRGIDKETLSRESGIFLLHLE